jgi:pantothenate kinase
MDGFHFSNARLDALGLRARKGAPETFDACGFVTALAKLAEGKMVSWPEYSRVLHEPLADSLTIPASTRLIFLEGNYLALDKTPWDRVPALLACLWYVDADLSSLRERLLSRQVDGGRAAADAIRHVEDVDVRNIMIVERCRDRATRVVRINPDDPLSYGVIDPATGKPFDLSR